MALLFVLLFVLIARSSSQQCEFFNKSLPIPLAQLQGVYWNHSVYLFGGEIIQDSVYSNKTYKWNMNIPDSWFEEIAGTPTSTFFSRNTNSVLVNDTVYFVGMHEGFGWSEVEMMQMMFAFHLPTESWIDNTDFNKPEYSTLFGCLATNQSHFFLVDGWNSAQPMPVLQIYDVKRNEWSTNFLDINNTEREWYYQYCSVVDNELYIFGGVFNGYRSEIYKYDFNAEELIYLADSPETLSTGQAIHFRNYLLLIGNYIPVYRTRRIPAFDLNLELVATSNISMKEEIYYRPASMIIDDMLFIFGGRINGNPDTAVQICALDEAEPEQKIDDGTTTTGENADDGQDNDADDDSSSTTGNSNTSLFWTEISLVLLVLFVTVVTVIWCWCRNAGTDEMAPIEAKSPGSLETDADIDVKYAEANDHERAKTGEGDGEIPALPEPGQPLDHDVANGGIEKKVRLHSDELYEEHKEDAGSEPTTRDATNDIGAATQTEMHIIGDPENDEEVINEDEESAEYGTAGGDTAQ